jgi:peptidoglycan/LPS O-acetylase OafA/YrhL
VPEKRSQIHCATQASNPSERVPELDGIRGVAILLVLVWHYFACRMTLPPGAALAELWSLCGLTYTGVDLFFVLSGFLIGGVLLDNCRSENYFKTFYVRRICRIFPLYYLFFIIFLAAATFGLGERSELKWLFDHPMPAWSYATFLQNFVMVQEGTFGAKWLGITWSLAVEEQFYLLLPLAIRYISKSKLPYFLLLCVVAAPVFRIGFYLFHPSSVSGGYVLMPCRADALMLGVLAACCVRSPILWQSMVKNRSMIYMMFGVLLVGAIFLNYTTSGWFTPQMTYWGRSWIALFYALFLLIPLLNRHGFTARVLRSWFLQKLGVVSYGLYLLHESVLGLTYAFIFHRGPRLIGAMDVLPTLTALMITFLTAFALYLLVEKPILRIGRTFQYGSPSPESLAGEPLIPRIP